MKVKFLRATKVGNRMHRPDEVVDVKNQAVAEHYIAHGYAVLAPGGGPPAAPARSTVSIAAATEKARSSNV